MYVHICLLFSINCGHVIYLAINLKAYKMLLCQFYWCLFSLLSSKLHFVSGLSGFKSTLTNVCYSWWSVSCLNIMTHLFHKYEVMSIWNIPHITSTTFIELFVYNSTYTYSNLYKYVLVSLSAVIKFIIKVKCFERNALKV